MTITFITATYNEQEEIDSLIKSVNPFVDAIRVCDDGSTDTTSFLLEAIYVKTLNFEYKVINHTGLPETVKNEALKMVPEWTDWVLMLDCDERIDVLTLQKIREWTETTEANKYSYVYFKQVEIIDGVAVREFQKAKLFRPDAIHFPLDNIHADDQFSGDGTYRADWVVSHRKSSTKQIVRETEYLQTYRRLLKEGKIDEGRYNWLVSLHHYVRPHG